MDTALRELVRSRAGSRCEYCHLPEQFSELHFRIEHVIPRQHGGTDGAENLALACPDCNLVEGPNLTGVEPGTHRVARVFHPRRDKWTEHFALDGALILGKTPVGRVTVSLLRMNDAQRLRGRALLSGL
jgi:5-methylcytosine-specific restriction endonuclease McrA